MNWSYLVIRNSKIVKNGEWPWPFTKMQKSDSANGQFQKMAIHFKIGHSLVQTVQQSHVDISNNDILILSIKMILNQDEF